MAKKTNTIHFVECKKEGHIQYSMHPHIYFKCPCGETSINDKKYERHEIISKTFESRNHNEWQLRFDAIILETEK